MVLRSKKDSTEWMEKDKGKEVASPEWDPRQEGKQPGLPRTAQRIPLPHNSMFVLGEATNRKWLHAIKQDKRLPTLLSVEEASYGAERISLTFRHIGTFLTENETKIWGQGATGKTREEAKPVFENNQQEVERMIFAFGTENHQAEEFEWDSVYGAGFDVLHFRNRLPKLFYRSQESISTTRILLALSEKGVDVEVEESERAMENKDNDGLVDEDDIAFTDCDIDRTTMRGSIPILLYLESFYTGEKVLGGIGKPLLPKVERHERGTYAQVLGLLLESERLREAVEEYRKATKSTDLSSSQTTAVSDESTPTPSPTQKHLQNTLDYFESQLYRISLGPSGKALGLTKGEEDVCFGGIGINKHWSAADCAIWPVLRKLQKYCPDGGFWTELGGNDRWPQLRSYIKRGWERPRVRRVFMGTDKKSDVKEEKGEAEGGTQVEEKGDGKELDKPKVDGEGIEVKGEEGIQSKKAKEDKLTEEQKVKGSPEAGVVARKQLEVRPVKKQLVEEKPVGKEKSNAAEESKVVVEESKAVEEKKAVEEESNAVEESKAVEEKSKAVEEESKAVEEESKAVEEKKVVEEKSNAAGEGSKAVEEKSKAVEELGVTGEGQMIEVKPTDEDGGEEASNRGKKPEIEALVILSG